MNYIIFSINMRKYSVDGPECQELRIRGSFPECLELKTNVLTIFVMGISGAAVSAFGREKPLKSSNILVFV